MDKDTPIKITTSTGKDYLPQATALISKTFTTDPVIRFMLSDLSDPDRLKYLSDYIHVLLKASALNDGAFQEANDWSCCAVWMPPGKRIDNPWTVLPAGLIGVLMKLGISGCKRMFLDFEAQSDSCKKKGLRDANGKLIKRYYYLWFIATDFHARGQGLASRMVSRYQDKAKEEGYAIWLEATTPKSRDIYLRQGFKIVQEMCLGKGTHAASGAREKGGSGVPVWAMIWRPDFLKQKPNGSNPGGDEAEQ